MSNYHYYHFLPLNLLQYLIDHRCLVGNCQHRLDHWTEEHTCQTCGHQGHSDYECNKEDELRVLLYTIKIRQKYLADCKERQDDSQSDSSSSYQITDEYTPLLKPKEMT